MAESSKAGTYQELAAAGARDQERWSPPQTVMLVTVLSAALWALIIAVGHWLIG